MKRCLNMEKGMRGEWVLYTHTQKGHVPLIHMIRLKHTSEQKAYVFATSTCVLAQLIEKKGG